MDQDQYVEGDKKAITHICSRAIIDINRLFRILESVLLVQIDSRIVDQYIDLSMLRNLFRECMHAT